MLIFRHLGGKISIIETPGEQHRRGAEEAKGLARTGGTFHHLSESDHLYHI